MKNIILVKCIGDRNKYGIGIPIVIDYCKKYNLSFDIISEYKIKLKNKHDGFRSYDVCFETLQVLDYLEDFDRALVIGGDVLITPNCPNIFEVYNDPNVFYGFHENNDEHCNRDVNINNMLEDFNFPLINWPLGPNEKRMYFNADVLIFSQIHKKYFDHCLEIEKKLHSTLMSEQDNFNFLLSKYNVKSESMSYEWNRMDMGNPDPNNLRLKANFIHYAGMGYGNENLSRYEVMKNDIKTLYDNKYSL